MPTSGRAYAAQAGVVWCYDAGLYPALCTMVRAHRRWVDIGPGMRQGLLRKARKEY